MHTLAAMPPGAKKWNKAVSMIIIFFVQTLLDVLQAAVVAKYDSA